MTIYESTTTRISNLDLDDDFKPSALVAAMDADKKATTVAPAPAWTGPPSAPYAGSIGSVAAPAPAPYVAPVVAAPVESNVSEFVAVEVASQFTGVQVFWNMYGLLDTAKLADAWTLDASWLPESGTIEAALVRACKEAAKSSKRAKVKNLVRQHPAGGLSIVAESSENKALTYVVGPRVSIKGDDSLAFDDGISADMQTQITASFNAYRTTKLDASQTGTWLSNLLTGRLNASVLRDGGGIYFVPAKDADKVRAIKAAIELTTQSRLTCIDMLRSTDLLVSVVDAVRREGEELANELEGELAVGLVTERKTATRIARCDEMTAKIRSYERLLGQSMPTLIGRLAGVRAALQKLTSRVAQLETND